MDVHVRDAISPTKGGEISCIVNTENPVHFEWYQNGATALLRLSSDRSRAYDVPPGFYTVEVTDAYQNKVTREIAISNTFLMPVISKYDVTHASSDTARNGKITVHVEPVEDFDFLWTSGVITSAPVLNDVRPGVYSACPLNKNGDSVTFIHECKPAIVNASRMRRE